MYFEAETDNEKYELLVSESDKGWKVSLKPEGKDWIHYEFSKSDYQYMDDTISFLFKDSSYLLDVTGEGIDYTVYTRGAFKEIRLYNEEMILHESLKKGGPLGSSDSLASQMPGKIVKVYVKPGDEVKSGDPLLVMEAMKMENEMRSDGSYRVKEVFVKEGQNVETNTQLISFEEIK